MRNVQPSRAWPGVVDSRPGRSETASERRCETEPMRTTPSARVLGAVDNGGGLRPDRVVLGEDNRLWVLGAEGCAAGWLGQTPRSSA